jgi:hypothetical protein
MLETQSEVQEKKLMTARQIWASKKIYWIKSYKSLLKYISEDYKHIFKPIEKSPVGEKSFTGKRYYVKEENVDEFVRMFENNEL